MCQLRGCCDGYGNGDVAADTFVGIVDDDGL
jgi:hypothetical protein